jgi:uncharacterized integral membrane protein
VKWPRIKRYKGLGIALLAFLAGVVVFQNTQTVEARFLFWKASMPSAALLFLTLALGFLLGLLVGYREARAKRAP